MLSNNPGALQSQGARAMPPHSGTNLQFSLTNNANPQSLTSGTQRRNSNFDLNSRAVNTERNNINAQPLAAGSPIGG